MKGFAGSAGVHAILFLSALCAIGDWGVRREEGDVVSVGPWRYATYILQEPIGLGGTWRVPEEIESDGWAMTDTPSEDLAGEWARETYQYVMRAIPAQTMIG